MEGIYIYKQQNRAYSECDQSIHISHTPDVGPDKHTNAQENYGCVSQSLILIGVPVCSKHRFLVMRII